MIIFPSIGSIGCLYKTKNKNSIFNPNEKVDLYKIWYWFCLKKNTTIDKKAMNSQIHFDNHDKKTKKELKTPIFNS